MSVIIPALNEATGIGATLASVTRQPGRWDVIVADGGSTDGTPEAVRLAMPTARVIAPGRGRARQMNAGAEVASGEILLFLHADTHLPEGALDDARAALDSPGVVAGCFRTAFVGEGADSAWMRLWESNLWMHWWRFAFGDRAPFVSREAFDAVGGFRSQPLFEDLDLVRDLRRQGRFVFLDSAVETSARRFGKHGALGQQLRNFGLWTAWNLGVPPETLARFYPAHRPPKAA
ncbi:MAG: TIGR04283 family arsenosugar biosynthesis glycosyltransferase [Bacteroidota bacterium]